MASAALGTAYRHLRDLFAAGSVVGLEDGPLLARYSRSNDPAAFEALVSRHGPMILATCRAVLKNEHDAEDAFQATFLVLAKKAHSVRGSEALGGWLHRVAYRASVQASIEARKRRRRETEAVMARRDSSRPETELAALLHEEIDRLPGSLRLPVVLCDLEGLTYEEAASQLGWTLPSLRHRLANARQRLKGRLARRGVLPLAIGASLASKATAAVPSALVRATLASATGGSPSAGVALLTHILLRGMLMTKIKLASTAALAAIALASAGGIALASGVGRPAEETKPARKPKADVVARPEPAGEKPSEPVEVRGIVVAPDGKPVAGATVRAVVDVAAPPESTSGADGRFRLRVPRQDRSNRPVGPYYPWIVASAPGFGIGWARDAFAPGPSGESTIRLVEDGPPVEGRVMDLEGRPVAGASVKVQTLWFAEVGGLDPWLAKVRDQQIQAPNQGGLQGLPTRIEGKTGPDGRFRLAGLGRDRVATLLIAGPTIASSEVQVVLREGPEIRTSTVDRRMVPVKTMVFHAPKFEFAAAPTRPVEGVVRDKDTGLPIAGLMIQARVFDGTAALWEPDVMIRTDDQGRYRLIGLPRAPAYRLSVYPLLSASLPYAGATLKAPADSPGLEPARFDFALKRGVVVEGRVTDKRTGQPVTGQVHAYTFRDNPNLGDFPGSIDGEPAWDDIDVEGRYRFVAIPGRNILACRSDDGKYRGGVGAREIEGFDSTYQVFKTVPRWLHIGNYHGLTQVDLDPKAGSVTFNLELDSGRSVMVTALDPEDRPIGGTVAKGVGDLFQSTTYPQESPTFEIHALDPSTPRRVTITHFGRKLVGTTFLRGDEVGPVVVRLRPWGTVAGRVVDEEGRPRKGLGLSSLGGSRPTTPETHGILPNGDWHNGILLGADGKFRVEGLIPGLKYGATAVNGSMQIGEVFEDLAVAPGEVRDLGDLRVKLPKP